MHPETFSVGSLPVWRLRVVSSVFSAFDLDDLAFCESADPRLGVALNSISGHSPPEGGRFLHPLSDRLRKAFFFHLLLSIRGSSTEIDREFAHRFRYGTHLAQIDWRPAGGSSLNWSFAQG